MKKNLMLGPYDITFVGSGISNSFTLLNLMKRLEETPVSIPVKIVILEQFPEFITGIPYGKRSGHSVLLITNLRDFLPEPERSSFIQWLEDNKNRLLKDFLEHGGVLSHEWYEQYAKNISEKQWEEVFVPRYFFGLYLTEQVREHILQIEKSNNISVDFIQAKVVNMDNTEDGWMVHTAEKSTLLTQRVVLGVGSLPTRNLWRNEDLIEKPGLLFVNDMYSGGINKFLDALRRFIRNNEFSKINVTIIGSNASALEALYRINDIEELAAKCDHFYFVSTFGLLPDGDLDEEKLKSFKPSSLIDLESQTKISARDIYEAAEKDLDRADKIKLGARSTVGLISVIIGQLLNRLDEIELKEFACHYGNEIGRRQRCAGKHYLNSVDLLKSQNRFEHFAGKFQYVEPAPGGNGWVLSYRETSSGEVKKIEEPVNVVINCTGFMDLESPRAPQLLRSLMEKGLAVPNSSKIGFEVNDRFETFTGLHIMGPLLGGNVIQEKAIWHVEHCGRISWLSELLAENLFKHLAYPEIHSGYELNILDIGSDNKAQKKYSLLLDKHWESNPYACIPYLFHHHDKDNRLLAFHMCNAQGDTLALMPMVIRPIDQAVEGETYYDAISPYGYSGPLYMEGSDLDIRNIFWNLIDQWYQEHHIVTEFIRFDLYGNHKGYSGQTLPTLNNVIGKILEDQEIQWEQFLPKVRNNYRKASKSGLEFKIAGGNDIDESMIYSFYSIYTDTMDRNQASSMYFFSKAFFKHLIYYRSEKFILAMAMKDGEVASAELLIVNHNNIHAFLGGTRSDFFQFRPNDYLRVEILKWASANGYSHYVLGGGRSNNDGLYKHKKAMFPKDPDIMYYTGRKILNYQVYNRLSNPIAENYDLPNDTADQNYFPRYRIHQVN